VEAHRVMRRRGSHIFSRQSAHRWRWGCHVPAAFYPPGRFLVLISVRGWVDPRTIVRLEVTEKYHQADIEYIRKVPIRVKYDVHRRTMEMQLGNIFFGHLYSFMSWHCGLWRHDLWMMYRVKYDGMISATSSLWIQSQFIIKLHEMLVHIITN
jgi:hypothetical protein